jgi:cephalosporin-C deacetylase-like acetyl esterase
MRRLVIVGLAWLSLAPPLFAEVTVAQADDRSVAVTAGTYSARIDGEGNLSLDVGGVPALEQAFKPEPGAPRTIRITNRMVAVRAGGARVEYTFEPESIVVVTEGFGFGFHYSQDVKAAVAPGGKGGAVGLSAYANCRGIVLTNGLTVAFDQPFHVGPSRHGQLVPSCYVNGSGKKPGDLLEFTLKAGQPAEAVELLSRVALETVGGLSPATLNKNGNKGGYIPHVSDPAKIVLSTKQANSGSRSFLLTYRMTVLGHYVAGGTVFEQEQAATLAPGGTQELAWTLPVLAPGFYYATVEVLQDGRKLTSEKLTFTVDLPHYSPPVTRPPDFTGFWNDRVAALRALPFEAKLTEEPSWSSDALVCHRLELTIAGGRRYSTVLLVPRKPGRHLGRFISSFDGKPVNADSNAVSIAMNLTDFGMATFNRWTSRDDNNMLDCYLLALRLTDYLRSRPDVGGIYLFGASRTGPIQFVNAALDSTRIVGVDTHVPTSAGIGWADKPYYGWGVPAGYRPEDPGKVADFTAMASYFDPVNFAPDMNVPWITAYGLDDTLSPPQGVEAMFCLAASPWKRISRDPGGHQYSPGFKQLQRELAEYIKAGGPAGGDDRILKEH